MKPIETVYKGYRFRSRLEAKWAVFFDELGVKWEYEPEGYDLDEMGWYLPGFKTHMCQKNHSNKLQKFGKAEYWIEKKGQHPTEEEEMKMAMLSRRTKTKGYIFFGDPLEFEFLSFGLDGEFGYHFCKFGVTPPCIACCTPREYDIIFRDSPLFQIAATKARGTRFEHGERKA